MEAGKWLMDIKSHQVVPRPPLNTSLYSLDTLEALDTECSCELEKGEDLISNVKCSWQMDLRDCFKYVSVGTSTFSIAYAILCHGFLDIVPRHLAIRKSFLFYGFGLLNLIYGMTMGAYHVYIAGMTKTPWFFLLIIPLILRIAPVNVWYNIFSEIFPKLKSARPLSFLPERVKVALMVCPLFWFVGMALGFDTLVALITNLSEDLYGRATKPPFESVFPSLDARTNCIAEERKKNLDCYKLNGWIDKAMGEAIIDRVYPRYFTINYNTEAYFLDFFGATDFHHVLLVLAFWDNNSPRLRMMFGNHWLWDPIVKYGKNILLADFILVFIFAQFLIFSSTVSLKEKVAILLISLLQISPLPMLYLNDESLISGIVLPLTIVSFAIITAIIIHDIVCRRSGLSSRTITILKWVLRFPFLLVPFFVESVFSAHQNIDRVFTEIQDFCLASGDLVESVHFMIGSSFDESPAIDESQMPNGFHFIKTLQSLETRFYHANYFGVFTAIYNPVLLVSAFVPLLASVADSLLRNLRLRKKCGRFWFLSVLIVTTFMSTLYLSSMKPSHLYAWDWRNGSVWNHVPVHLNMKWINTSRYLLDLEQTNQTHKEAMLYQIRKRIGPTIHHINGLTGCGYMRSDGVRFQAFPQKSYLSMLELIFFDLRAQYIGLSRYKVYPDIYSLVLIPCLIFLGAYFYLH